MVAIANKQLYRNKKRVHIFEEKYYGDPLVTSSSVELISMLREKIPASLKLHAGCQLQLFQNPAVKCPVFFWHITAWRTSRSFSVLNIFFPSNSSWQMKSPAHCLSIWFSDSKGEGSKIHTELHGILPGKVYCHNIFFSHKRLHMYCSIHRSKKCQLLANWTYHIDTLLYSHHTSRWCFWPPTWSLCTLAFCWKIWQNF